MHRVDDLAIDVELKLLVRGIADADRRDAFIAGQPGKLHLGEPALAGQAVHDLHLRRLAGDGAQQPVAPGSRLPRREPGNHQRVEGEGCVAKPAIAVIPVARPADLSPGSEVVGAATIPPVGA